MVKDKERYRRINDRAKSADNGWAKRITEFLITGQIGNGTKECSEWLKIKQ